MNSSKSTEEFFNEKIETFKERWQEQATEKTIFFFRRGMEIRQNLAEHYLPAIGAEHFFDDVLSSDEEHYPNFNEYKDCKQAFSHGFTTDLRM